ncbi:MAG: NADH-quinone oxidoreductase subunit H [Anaerolineae bacterium]|nr:NADH-quinone oxidoreductase subunit H [Anaerolineae bacterium]
MSAIPTRVLPQAVPQTEADMRRRRMNKWIFIAGFVLPGVGVALDMPSWLVTITRVGAMFAKILFFCWLNVQIRWTLLRFRFDQVIRLGWTLLLPLALANIFITGVVLLAR